MGEDIKEKQEKQEKILSASRIKTLENCSWLYWTKYHLKIPDIKNEGSIKGNICHTIFECLLKKKHKKLYDKVVKSDSIFGFGCLPILRYVKRQLIKEDIFNEDNLEHVNQMILVGLKNDFFDKGWKLLKPEYEFKIDNEDPRYVIRGFIDKTSSKKGEIKITDYKSSKNKFEGSDLDFNVQSLAYQLVGKKENPKAKKITTRFLFLQFPNDPFQELQYDNDTLDGFEYYLADKFEQINNFTEDDARSNMAIDHGFPKDGSFTGKKLCSLYCSYFGQLKKDGSRMWHCPAKFAFDYYALVDKEGNVKKTSFEESDLIKSKNNLTESENLVIVKKSYGGCPAFKQETKENDDFNF